MTGGQVLVDHAIHAVAALLGSFRQTVDIDPGFGVDEISTVDNSADNFVVKLVCVDPTADFDANGAVDLGDFAHFQNCLTGDAPAICPNGCERFDFDARDDITLSDFAAFLNAFDWQHDSETAIMVAARRNRFMSERSHGTALACGKPCGDRTRSGR